MLNYFSKHLSLIVSLLIFSFVFYIGCTTTETGKIESDELHVVKIDSFYFAVNKKNDTINLANTSAKLKKGEESSDDIISYRVTDSVSANKILRSIKTSELKSLFAKYTKVNYTGTILVIVGAAAVLVALAAYLIAKLLTDKLN